MSDKERVERLGGRIVMALSAEGQLIALLLIRTGPSIGGLLRGIAKHRLNLEVQPMPDLMRKVIFRSVV
jgi:hypothetical protein